MSNEDIVENLSNICVCCYNEDDNLKCIYKSYQRKGKTENYSEMLNECFCIVIKTETLNAEDTMKICEECIIKLRESLLFRKQIEISQTKLMKHVGSYKNEDTDENKISICDGFKVEVDDDADVLSSDDIRSEPEEMISPTNKGSSSNPSPTPLCSSEDILKRALERTQRNIQLLNETCQNPFKQEKIDPEAIPKDKKARKLFLRRISYGRRIPYKLDKTDRDCKECHQKFPSHKMLVNHMPEHYPNHICTQCGKMFILREHWQRHMSRHEKILVTCDICKKSVKKDSLLRHIQAHNGDNFVHKCYYCEEKFKSYTTFINHMVNKHDHKSNEHKCHLCSKVFKVAADQKRHIREVHLGERRISKPRNRRSKAK